MAEQFLINTILYLICYRSRSTIVRGALQYIISPKILERLSRPISKQIHKLISLDCANLTGVWLAGCGFNGRLVMVALYLEGLSGLRVIAAWWRDCPIWEWWLLGGGTVRSESDGCLVEGLSGLRVMAAWWRDCQVWEWWLLGGRTVRSESDGCLVEGH